MPPTVKYPAYSLDGFVWIAFPNYYIMGGEPDSQEEANINFESDTGKAYVYRQFVKEYRELNFKFLEPDLDAFRQFHSDVNGEVTPFYLSLIGDGSDSLYVRKEAGFHAIETNEKSSGYPIYTYTLRCKEEIT